MIEDLRQKKHFFTQHIVKTMEFAAAKCGDLDSLKGGLDRFISKWRPVMMAKVTIVSPGPEGVCHEVGMGTSVF